jgi:hypothetical protein
MGAVHESEARLRLCSSRIVSTVGIASIALASSTITANAQTYPPQVVAHCARVAQKMPSMSCTTRDKLRDYMEHACDANGGRVPGSLTVFDRQPYDNGPAEQDREFSQ